MGYGPLRVHQRRYRAAGQGFGTHGHATWKSSPTCWNGALEHKDSMGNGSVIRPGSVQRHERPANGRAA